VRTAPLSTGKFASAAEDDATAGPSEGGAAGAKPAGAAAAAGAAAGPPIPGTVIVGDVMAPGAAGAGADEPGAVGEEVKMAGEAENGIGVPDGAVPATAGATAGPEPGAMAGPEDGGRAVNAGEAPAIDGIGGNAVGNPGTGEIAEAAAGEGGRVVKVGEEPATVGTGGTATAAPGMGVDSDGVPVMPVVVGGDDPAGVSPEATGVVPDGTMPAFGGGVIDAPGLVGETEVVDEPGVVDEPWVVDEPDDVPLAQPPRVSVNAS